MSLVDDFKASVLGLTDGVAKLTQAVTDLSARVAAGGTGGSVSNSDVAIAIAALQQASGALLNATNQLNSLVTTPPVVAATGIAAVPTAATNFADPLK